MVNDSGKLTKDEARFQIREQCARVTAEGALERIALYRTFHTSWCECAFGNPIIDIDRGLRHSEVSLSSLETQRRRSFGANWVIYMLPHFKRAP